MNLWWQMKLKNNEIERIDSNKKEIEYAAGEIVTKQGGDATHVYVIQEGMAINYIEKNKEKRVFQIVCAVDLAVLPPLEDDTSYTYTTKTITPSIICQIKKEIFYNIILQNLNASKYIFKRNSERTKCLLEIIKRDFSLGSTGKIASVLLDLDTIKCTSEYKGINVINKELISSLANVSEDNTRKILTDLKKEKIIDMNGWGIQIVSHELLKKLSLVG